MNSADERATKWFEDDRAWNRQHAERHAKQVEGFLSAIKELLEKRL